MTTIARPDGTLRFNQRTARSGALTPRTGGPACSLS